MQHTHAGTETPALIGTHMEGARPLPRVVSAATRATCSWSPQPGPQKVDLRERNFNLLRAVQSLRQEAK